MCTCFITTSISNFFYIISDQSVFQPCLSSHLNHKPMRSELNSTLTLCLMLDLDALVFERTDGLRSRRNKRCHLGSRTCEKCYFMLFLTNLTLKKASLNDVFIFQTYTRCICKAQDSKASNFSS